MTEPRPESVAAMLTTCADFLDKADEALAATTRTIRRLDPAYPVDPYDPSDEMQSDLRRLRDWLLAHPDLDAAMYDATFGVKP